MRVRSLAFALLPLCLMVLTACGPQAANCIQPDVFCVGLVTETGRLEDRSYNQATWEGIQLARTNGTADRVASIESRDSRDYLANLRVFAEAGYDAVVSVGSSTSDALYTAAGQYPNVYFIGVDQPQPEEQTVLRNLTRLTFPEDHLGFLAGALAAMMSETGQVAAICASDFFPAMQRYGNGFLEGVAYVELDVDATVIYHNQASPGNSFTDPVWGAETANTLIDSGVDVIFGAGGTTGDNAIVAAAMRGIYGIGADNDLYYSLPVAAPRILTSVIKDIPDGVASLLRLARDAQAGDAIFPAGTAAGQVGLAPYHDLDAALPQDIKLKMSELLQALTAGEILVGAGSQNP